MHDDTHSTTIHRTRPLDPVRVGVLSLHSSKETRAICNAVAALGHEPVWLGEGNLGVRIGTEGVTVTPRVDVVINRHLCSKADDPFDDMGLVGAIESSVPLLNPSDAVAAASHKVESLARLAADGIPVPESALETARDALEARRAELGRDVVQKPVVGTNGQGMTKLRDGDVASPKTAGARSYIQEFVESGEARAHAVSPDGGAAVGQTGTAATDGAAWDLRVYVVDGEVIGAMRRTAAGGDWRANVARGGDVAGVDPAPAVAHRAVKATATLGLDYAGVDLLPRRTDDGTEWVVVEVNPTAGFRGLFAATGTSPAPFIATAAIRRVGYDPDPDEVARLAGTLDDSEPVCGRPGDQEATDDETDEAGLVPLSQRVAVGADGGTTIVQAKADTGAARTSVGFDLAAEIGAGPIVDTTRIRSGGGGPSKPRPMVELDVQLDGRWRTVTATLADRSRMSHELLLGRDALDGMQVVVDRMLEE